MSGKKIKTETSDDIKETIDDIKEVIERAKEALSS